MADRVLVAGVSFDLVTRAELIDRVADALQVGRGGTIVTPNIDICHKCGTDPASRALVESACIVVPDGVPLLWAARLARRPLVERITGAELIFSLPATAAAHGGPVYGVRGAPPLCGRGRSAAD